MGTHKIFLSWQEGQQKWAAVSHAPLRKALAKSPQTAVNRLKRALLVQGANAEFMVSVQLPTGAQTSVAKYLDAMKTADKYRKEALEHQLVLAETLLSRYGLNRSQAAAAVGLSHSYLGKVLDGKVSRTVSMPPPIDPAKNIADFVNTPASERHRIPRNGKKR